MFSHQSNYNGRQPNNTSYIKNFITDKVFNNFWKLVKYNNETVIAPSINKHTNVYIPGNLYVNGNITHMSNVQTADMQLKNNINAIEPGVTNKLLELMPISFTLTTDIINRTHYGFISQDVENKLPDLVQTLTLDNPLQYTKTIDYLEIIPLLVHKIKEMQLEIDILKNRIVI